MKGLVLRTPIVGTLVRFLHFRFRVSPKGFKGSESYWKDRYSGGGNSGSGSYERLATFKARIINEFVERHSVASVIEFGCGDGNQLRLARYPSYIGFDVSSKAVELCATVFAEDRTKSFGLVQDYAEERAELTLSLDVIYHLTENEVFEEYMGRLFDAASRYVIVYSSNTDDQERFQSSHVRHRRFTDWIAAYRPQARLLQHVPNAYPYKGDDARGSCADFYLFELVR